MGIEPCATAEMNPNSSLIIFREKMDETCVYWMPPLHSPKVLPRLVENQPHHVWNGAVGRMTVGQNIYVGHVHEPRQPGYAYFPVNGEEVAEQTNYEVLLVSPSCSLAWVPYIPGDTVPAAALKLGFISGVGPTYSIRVQRPDLNTIIFEVYAAGDTVAYYNYFGVQPAMEVDILVRVWD